LYPYTLAASSSLISSHFPSLIARGVLVYIAAYSSFVWPLVPGLFAHNVPMHPYTCVQVIYLMIKHSDATSCGARPALVGGGHEWTAGGGWGGGAGSRGRGRGGGRRSGARGCGTGGVQPRQGLTFVHVSAQPEPFLKQKHNLRTPLCPITPPKQPLNAPPIPQKALKLS